MFANVWRKPETPAWLPDDFLDDGSNRIRRVAEYKREQEAVMVANARLAQIVEGAPPSDDIPAWARGPFQGAAN